MAKIRNGFVSNSSSSSFIVQKKNLIPEQIQKIVDVEIYAKDSGVEYPGEAQGWKITDDGETLSGHTYMDNFDMEAYFRYIGIDNEKVQWDD